MHIGTFFKVPLYVSSWFLLMVGMMSAVGYEEDGIRGIFAFNAFLVFIYISVAMHEYGHVAAGTRVGLSFANVTLGAFGGVAKMQDNDDNSFFAKISNWQEFAMTICGPLVNVAIAVVLFLCMHLFGTFDIQHAEALRINTELLQWGPIQPHLQAAHATFFSVSSNLDTVDDFLVMVFFSNIVMCVFNMIPTYPMDGGRILRCFLRLFLSFSTSTRIVTYVSQALCVLMFYYGLQIFSVGLLVISTAMFFICFLERSRLKTSETHDAFVDLLQRTNAALALPEDQRDTMLEKIDFSVAVRDGEVALCQLDVKVLVAAANALGVPLNNRIVMAMPLILGVIPPDPGRSS